MTLGIKIEIEDLVIKKNLQGELTVYPVGTGYNGNVGIKGHCMFSCFSGVFYCFSVILLVVGTVQQIPLDQVSLIPLSLFSQVHPL